jgi:DNA mismatch repair protein MSH6
MGFKSGGPISGQRSIQSFFRPVSSVVREGEGVAQEQGADENDNCGAVTNATNNQKIVDASVVKKTNESVVVAMEEDVVVGQQKDSAAVGSKKDAARARRKKVVRTMVLSDDDEEDGVSSGSEYMAESEEEEEEDDVEGLEQEDLDDDDEEEMKTPATSGRKNKSTIAKKKKGSMVTTGGASVRTPQMGFASSSAQKNTKNGLEKKFQTPRSDVAITAGHVERTPLSATITPGRSLGQHVQQSLSTPELASKFSQRESERFPFLDPLKIKDSQMRSPTDPAYDPSTLYIPPQWFKQHKVSEGQKQWWEFKASNFDSVLLFKMGKFYELFEMDAHIGAECLGLSYMKGDQPHVGFPEIAYAEMAERLARAGHRVVVIEQVETPEMLASRNAENKKAGKKRENVVRREKVAVITKATITDGDMMRTASESEYLACIVDRPSKLVGEDDEQKMMTVGLVAVDIASARVIVGQFKDDGLRSHLRAVLTALQPAEVALPREEEYLSADSRKTIKGILKGQPQIYERPVGDDDGCFYSASKFWDALESSDYFDNADQIPEVLRTCKQMRDEYGVLSFALGGMMSHLKRGMLDSWVFCGSKFMTIEDVLGQLGRSSSETHSLSSQITTSTMALDGAALENLEILENGEGGITGTLLGSLDRCVTPFGKRKLREWLCRPLFRIKDIQMRQNAVKDLMEVAIDAAGEARQLLSGLTDIERAIVRLCASGIGVGPMRESSPRVILYEDVSKKKIKAISATLTDIHKTLRAVKAFSNVDIHSDYLKSLVHPTSFPDIENPLNELLECVDWAKAEKDGRIQPTEGTDEAYDKACDKVREADNALKQYLEELRASLKQGSKSLRYASLNKDPYVLEAPDSVQVPSTWESIQGKKGVKRYMTDRLKHLAANMAHALEQKEFAQTQILQNITAKFASYKTLWLSAVDCIANLDALMSLAKAASCSDGDMCCPEFIEPGDSIDTSPVFHATALRHPAGIVGYGSGGFVPNNVHLGGDATPFMLLTGPNMGGKSTIMRQVCLATIAAQIGAWIPAQSMTLSPVDAVFVRMGAKDHIMLGQSTFFIELSETAAALHRATRHSLVALDELGRGTATIDGSSIASAVLEYLAHTVKCRGIFATHYHNVADSYKDDTSISLKHMGCTVRESDDGSGVEDVIFLYQLCPGACPKSYGSNVAKLAGLPLDVVSRASTISHTLDQHAQSNQIQHLASRAVKACTQADTKELMHLQSLIQTKSMV